MCGIFGAAGAAPLQARRALRALHHRGPDARALVDVGGVQLAHARLAVVDLDPRSDQPMRRGSTTVSFNGEIWNFRAVRAELEAMGRVFTTEGDSEVVAHALDAWGAGALPRFQGMFAVAWTSEAVDRGTLFAARDRFGEVPFHLHMAAPFMVASELKALLAADADPRAIEWVQPGEVVRADHRGVERLRWYELPRDPESPCHSMEEAASRVGELVEAGVWERACADAPVCCLLSGGIDSAAIARALQRARPDLVAYTAVMDPKSRDLRAARAMAAAIGMELREVPVAAPTSEDLSRVVGAIEMPHKAQVEIGWACLVLARRMRADGFKVTFSGEGSDELWASYGFAHHGIAKEGWGPYRRGLFLGQHRKNFARCNKVFMAHGIECRLPFLSTPLVEYALSLPISAVQRRSRPKAVMQDAFASLPDEIVRRQKMAFQDGLGLKAAIEALLGTPPAALYRRAFEVAFRGASS